MWPWSNADHKKDASRALSSISVEARPLNDMCLPPLNDAAWGQGLARRGHESAGQGPAWPPPLLPALRFPASARVCPGIRGDSDLQLSLFELRLGSARRPCSDESNGDSGRPLPLPLRVASGALSLLACRAMFPGLPLREAACGIAALDAVVRVLSRPRPAPTTTRAPSAPSTRHPLRPLLSALDAARDRAGAARSLIEGGLFLAGLAYLLANTNPDLLAASHALLALIPMAASYQNIGVEAARGKLRPGLPLEAAYKKAHRRAARVLAPHLTDLRPNPPFAVVLELMERVVLLCAVNTGPGLAAPTMQLSCIAAGSSSFTLYGSADLAGLGDARRKRMFQAEAASTARNGREANKRLASDVNGATEAAAAAVSGGRVESLKRSTSGVTDSLSAPRPAGPPDTAALELYDMLTGRNLGDEIAPYLSAPAGPSGYRSTASRGLASLPEASCPGEESRPSTPYAPRGPSARGTQNTQASPPPTPIRPRPSASGLSSGTGPAPAPSAPAGFYRTPSYGVGSGPGSARGGLLPQHENDDLPEGLALFGQGDHAGSHGAAAPYTARDRMELAARGSWLVMVFLPFIFFGTALLLTHKLLESSKGSAGAGAGPSGGGSGGPAAAARESRNGSEASVPPTPRRERPGVNGARARAGVGYAASSGAALVDEFLEAGGVPSLEPPRARAASGAGAAAATEEEEEVFEEDKPSWMRLAAWRLLLTGCRHSGVAFIKWGQWAATRGDLFPKDLCEVLSELHDQAPTHSFAATRAAIEEHLGRPIESIFEDFDPKPLASGSVAQVHRAVLKMPDGTRREVAVKVRHPNVRRLIERDFQLLRPLARASRSVAALRTLNLHESVKQFSATMTAQTDLRVEAVHLRRALSNFQQVGHSVTAPAPLPGLVSEGVLVESFEAGDSVAQFIRRPSPLNTRIVAIGLETYIRMLLTDNFVHTDLHPGNILARVRDTPATSRKAAAAAEAAAPGGAHAGSGARGAGGAGSASVPSAYRPLSQVLMDHTDEELLEQELQLVLLDYGLAEELSGPTRHKFLSFLFTIGRGDGARAAEILLTWSAQQECPDAAGFTRDMVKLFEERCDIERGIDVDTVLKEVLRIARHHDVSVDGSLASLVIGVCVICGFATSLDPSFNLIDAAVPAFTAYNLVGRVIGRGL